MRQCDGKLVIDGFKAFFLDYSDDAGSKPPWTALKMKAASSS
jgi:hypothetical protein